MRVTVVLLAALAAGCRQPPPPAAPAPTPLTNRLAQPVRLEADGTPLDSGYPFLGDLDGDGRPELLLGGAAEGRLRVYPIVGGRLGAPHWFDDANPTGRIPAG